MTLRDAYTNLSAVASSVRKQMKIARSIQFPITRKLAERLRQIVDGRELIQRRVARLSSMAEGWRDDSERFLQIMLDMEWPPPANVPVRLISAVARLDEEGRLERDELESVLLQYYEPTDLRQMLESWREQAWIGRRVHILEAAMEAHIRGEYELSIPAILPQVEGIVGEAFGHRGKLYGPVLEKYIEELLAENRPGSLRDATRVFWLTTARAPAPLGVDPPELSRHAILHGVDPDYAEETKSLRVILLFDRVQDSIRYVATEGGARYHKPGCSHLGPPRSNRVVFVSEHDVAEQGHLTPCQVCQPA